MSFRDWWHFLFPTIWHSFPTRTPWDRLLLQKVIVVHLGKTFLVLYSLCGVTYSTRDRYHGFGGTCCLLLLGWRLFGLLLGITFWLKFTKYLAIVVSKRCIMWRVHKLYVIRLYQRVHIHIRNKHEATVLKYSGTESKYFITIYFPITESSETNGTLAYNMHKRWWQNYSYVSIKTLNFTCLLLDYTRSWSLLDLKIVSNFSKQKRIRSSKRTQGQLP